MIFATRSPAPSVSTPPQPERSAIISGVRNGAMNLEMPNTARKIKICGSGIAHKLTPSPVANTAAVKKSSTALLIKSEASPVMPSFIAPYQPKPLQQNSATMVMYTPISTSLPPRCSVSTSHAKKRVVFSCR